MINYRIYGHKLTKVVLLPFPSPNVIIDSSQNNFETTESHERVILHIYSESVKGNEISQHRILTDVQNGVTFNTIS